MQSVQYWISACIAASSLHDYLIWRSCSSGRNFARAVSMFLRIRLLSDSTLRWTPLPSANDSYCQVRSGLSPPSYRPCRAHTVNGGSLRHFSYTSDLSAIDAYYRIIDKISLITDQKGNKSCYFFRFSIPFYKNLFTLLL